MNPLGNSKVAHLVCQNIGLKEISRSRAKPLALSWEFFQFEEQERRREIAELQYKLRALQEF